MSDLVPEVGWLLAFGGGLVSFFSPCCAPLVPGYLSFISGVSLQDRVAGGVASTSKVLGSSLLFVLGFSLVFVLLGASASLLGSIIDEYRQPLTRIAGGVMVLMGLFIMGLFKVPLLYQERRFALARESLGPLGPLALGMAFAFGWVPCIGPILASILFYASAAETVERGALLLLIYSLGLGVPFIVAGVGFTRMVGLFGWVRRHYQAINLVSGGILVAVGILFLTNRFFFLNMLAQRLYYAFFY